MAEILSLIQGTTEISLINGTDGIRLSEWVPNLSVFKDGGVIANSPLSEERGLSFGIYDSVDETFRINVSGSTQALALTNLSNLQLLLVSGAGYWIGTGSQPLYIKVKFDDLTSPVYAVVINHRFPTLTNPFGRHFVYGANVGPTIENVDLIITRGHWLSEPYGEGQPVTISVNKTWRYKTSSHFESSSTIGSPVTAWLAVMATNENVVASDSGGVLRYSGNRGASWSNATGVTSPTVQYFFKLSANNILGSDTASGGRIIFSDDGGATWTTRSSAVGGDRIYQMPSSGDLLIIDGNVLYRSADDGVNWTSIAATPTNAFKVTALTDSIFFCAVSSTGILYRSIDAGLTWSAIFSIPSVIFELNITNGNQIVVGGVDPELYVSTDQGVNWTNADPGGGGGSFNNNLIFQGSDGIIRLGRILISSPATTSVRETLDYRAWDIFPGLGQTGVSISESENGDMWGCDANQVNRRLNDTISVGSGDTNESVFISNCNVIGNLTHIFVYDDSGTSFSSNLLPMTSFPVTLFPDPVEVGDIIYIGTQDGLTGFNSPFSLKFDIGQIMSPNDGFTGVWEGYFGVVLGWVALDVQDGTASFSKTGENSVHWYEFTNNLSSFTINSIIGYWVRFRVTAVPGTVNSLPQQQNSDIYSLTSPYIDIEGDQVAGELPALLKLEIENVSDSDGPGGNEPDLYTNRLIIGSRSLSRGVYFSSYINTSQGDERNPFGVYNKSTGTDTSHPNNQVTPNRNYLFINPTGTQSMTFRSSYAISSVIAQQYYGSHRLLLRGYRTAGSASEFQVQIRASSFTGGAVYESPIREFQTTNPWEILDFGQIQFPIGIHDITGVLSDETSIEIWSSGTTSGDLWIFDIILIPTDEWAIDVYDAANSSASELGRSGDASKTLIIDSIVSGRRNIVTPVNLLSTGNTTNLWTFISNGRANLLPATDQRLWFLAMRTSTTGASYSWIAEPFISHKVKISKIERFLSFKYD